MKRIITKEEHAKLVPQLQAEYNLEGDTATLDLTDYEDPAALKRAKDHERDNANKAAKLAKDLQAQLDALTKERDDMLKGAIPKADVERLEASYKEKGEKRESELKDQIKAAQTSLQKLLVDNVATTMASEISATPTVLMPHIKSRLKTERTESGEFVTRVLDKDGKPSALTVQELKDEFVLNPDFKSVITGSKASGGGAGGGKGGGGAGTGKVDWSKSPAEIAAALKSKVEATPER